MATPVRERPTADVIVIILACVVAFVVVVVTIVAVGGVITGQTQAVGTLLKSIGDLTGSLISLLVGYLAGRGVPTNGNGKKNGTTKPPSE